MNHTPGRRVNNERQSFKSYLAWAGRVVRLAECFTYVGCSKKPTIERGDTAEAAISSYVAPGDLDEYYLFYSGGHSGNVYVAGVPSMRHISTIPSSRHIRRLVTASTKNQKKCWAHTPGATYITALSETKGDYDGRWLFVNDNANNRMARIDLRDFKTKQIFGPVPNISGYHGGSFVTPNTEYVLAASRFSIRYRKAPSSRWKTTRPSSRASSRAGHRSDDRQYEQWLANSHAAV